jgi:flagellar assembly protein FliH
MGLIKAQDAPAVVRFKWRDIEAEAQKLLAEAARQADAIREAAREDGYRDGHDRGLVDVRDEGLRLAIDEHAEQLELALGALHEAVAQVTTSKEQLHGDAVTDMVELAIAIARRVTKRQAMFDPQVLVANLREALGLSGRGRQLRVAIHPTQHQVLMQAMPQLAIEWPALSQAQIVEDASLAPGGCRVFTEHGQIDADLENQLDRVVGGLMPAPSNEAAA